MLMPNGVSIEIYHGITDAHDDEEEEQNPPNNNNSRGRMTRQQ